MSTVFIVPSPSYIQGHMGQQPNPRSFSIIMDTFHQNISDYGPWGIGLQLLWLSINLYEFLLSTSIYVQTYPGQLWNSRQMLACLSYWSWCDVSYNMLPSSCRTSVTVL